MHQTLNKQNHFQSHAPPEKLFTGVLIRWSCLTTPEKVVCANIVLLPVWWLVGIINYLLLSLSLWIVLYEWLRYGRLSLKRPSLAVITLFAFYAYESIDALFVFLDAYPSIDIPSDSVVSLNNVVKSVFQFSIPFLVWYIQSNNTKVRLEVVAWACSVSVIQMLLGWLIFQFAFPGWIDNPPRNLYAILTGKSNFTPGDVEGWTNYLAFYDEDRVRFFFGHYQAAAAYLGFVSLIAIDLKNRLWSCLLVATSFFLLILIGSRSVWLALPVALSIRLFLTLVKWRLTALVFAFLAIFSFATLSLTPVTEMIFATFTDTASTVADAQFKPILASGAKIMFTPSRLSEPGHINDKNLRGLIFVLAQLKHLGHHYHGVIIGQDYSPDKLHTRTLLELAEQLGVAERLTILPPTFAIEDYYQYADVVVTLAPREPFGRTVVEAIACGVPVVGSKTGGIGEILDNFAPQWTVDPDNPMAVAQTIIRVAEDANTSLVLAQGLKWVKSHCSPAKYAQKIVEIVNLNSPTANQKQTISTLVTKR